MSCYDNFPGLSTDFWSDLAEAQQLNTATPPFSHDLSFLHPTEISDSTDLAIFQLNFHQELFLDTPALHSISDQNFLVLETTSLNEFITGKECQTLEVKTNPDLSQNQHKAKPSGQDDCDRIQIVEETRDISHESSINQAELKYVKFSENSDCASFLEHKLGPTKWKIFTEKLVVKRRDLKQQQSPSGIIDFLVKTEIIKEVFRRFLPSAYSEVNYAVHTWSKGTVIVTRAAVFTLSGWSKVFFSYWSRRAERLALLSFHDDRLQLISCELERRLKRESEADCVIPFCPTTDTVVQSIIQMTTRRLDAILKETKERTGLNSTKLRGKHSMLDAYIVAKDRFFACSSQKQEATHPTSSFGSTAQLVLETRYLPFSKLTLPSQTASLASSDLVRSTNSSRNSRSAQGRNMFRLQHGIDPTAEVVQGQQEFEFEWQWK